MPKLVLGPALLRVLKNSTGRVLSPRLLLFRTGSDYLFTLRVANLKGSALSGPLAGNTASVLRAVCKTAVGVRIQSLHLPCPFGPGLARCSHGYAPEGCGL